MLFCMTIERTVEAPSDRRLRIDLTLPETFAPGSGAECRSASGLLEREAARRADWEAAFPLEPGETAMPLYGLFESDGHEVDRFLEEKRREIEAEYAADEREAGESGGFAR
jgi:hypothetical protein